MAFEPRIVGFLCNWCSYAGADLAGVSRIQYPPNLRVIRVMCSGRVDHLAEKAGLEPGRLNLEWVSASEGQRFANLVREFTEQVRVLGPSPVSGDSPDPALQLNLNAAKAAAEGFRLRALVGKEEKLVTEGNIYGEEVSQEEWDQMMTEAVETEFTRHRIHLALKEHPTSVKALSERLSLPSKEILEHVVALRQRGMVDIQEIRGSSPIYMALEVPQ